MYESCKVLIIKYIFIKSDSSTRTSIDEFDMNISSLLVQV